MTQSLFRTISAVLFFLTLFSAFANAADKVVVIPLNSSKHGSPDRLWGDGRRNANTLQHDTGTENGHCTTTTGINFALSEAAATWEGAQSVCPKDTWVCNRADIREVACPATILSSWEIIFCNGEWSSPHSTTVTNPPGWLADRGENTGIPFALRAVKLPDDDGSLIASSTGCNMLRVWCCWK